MNKTCEAPQAAAGPNGIKYMTLLTLALLCMAQAIPQAHALSVNLDTSSLAGTPARLDFYLLDGDGAENNSATVSGMAVDGTPLAGAPASATFTDAGGFGEFTQDLVLGAALHFGLSFSNNFAGGDPDRLVLALLDPGTNFSLVTTNLDLTDATSVEDALLTVDFTGGAGNLIRQATASNPAVGVAVVPSPEPWSLAVPWLLWLAWRGRPSQSARAASAR